MVTSWMLASVWMLAALVTASQRAAYSSTPKKYTYRSYGENVQVMKDLQQKYPHLIEVTTAQEAYGLQSPGTCRDVNNANVPCKQWIVSITDKTTMPDVDRPEVFFSGCLHGDEVIGPITVMEMMILLVEKYDTNRWVRRMVRTRIITMMPMTNAIGFQNSRRGENGIDTNRDFPYDQHRCLRTITGRSLYELWTRHLFQLALTFHGGMRAIAYEWGSNNHRTNLESPDDIAQVELSKAMSKFAAGHHHLSAWYPYKAMTALVYPVDGGMEDWAYAASWEPKYVHNCNPSNYGGYSPERQSKLYNNVSMRTFNILIETSDYKHPPDSELGTNAEIFKPNGKGDGHVPRNMRLMAVMIDAVQPYIETEPRGRAVVRRAMEVQWEVGGAVNVDSTRVLWGRWPSANVIKLLQHQHKSRSGANATRTSKNWVHQLDENSPLVQGKSKLLKWPKSTRWSDEFRDIFAEPFKAAYKANVTFPEDGVYFVVVVARVDGHMGDQKHPDPGVRPQSNYVNARVNDQWLAETALADEVNQRHRVRGQTLWRSRAIHVTVQTGKRKLTEPPSKVYPGVDDEDPFEVPHQPLSPPSPRPSVGVDVTVTVLGICVLVTVVVVVRRMWARVRSGGGWGSKGADFAENEVADV